MTLVKITKYLKIIDIQRILMYVFNRAKRPSFIQFIVKPKSIILVFLNTKSKVKNGSFLNEKKTIIEINNFVNENEIKKKNNSFFNNTKTLIEINNSVKKNEQKKQNSSFLNEDKANIDDIESFVTQKEMKFSENIFNFGIRTCCSINETLSLNLIYQNLLNDISVKDNNFDFITEEAINMLEKHDITQIFSYREFIRHQTSFNTDVFKKYIKPNKKTKYFLIGIDCEMFMTKSGKRAGRVSMVDNTGKLLYDKYVIPTEPVIDFLEEYSGLNQNNTKNGIEFRQMQEEILEFIGTNTYICGHGLENDLEVLELYTEHIIDTAYLFLNSQGYKLKLKQLAWCYLKEVIQTGKHNPVEDALSCLKLLNYKIQQLIKMYDFQSNKIKLNGIIRYIDELDEMKKYLYTKALFFYKADIEEIENIERTSELFPLFFYEEEGKNFLAY